MGWRGPSIRRRGTSSISPYQSRLRFQVSQSHPESCWSVFGFQPLLPLKCCPLSLRHPRTSLSFRRGGYGYIASFWRNQIENQEKGSWNWVVGRVLDFHQQTSALLALSTLFLCGRRRGSHRLYPIEQDIHSLEHLRINRARLYLRNPLPWTTFR